MIFDRVPSVAAVLLGMAILGAPACLAAGPGSSPSVSQPGTWRLVPLANQKVPAAWVINTETGDTYLCGSGSSDGRAHVACIEANFSNQSPK